MLQEYNSSDYDNCKFIYAKITADTVVSSSTFQTNKEGQFMFIASLMCLDLYIKRLV